MITKMECDSTMEHNRELQNNIKCNSYNVNFWKEFKRRWMVLGVLGTVALAVLAPRIGAPGGPLHSEYLIYLPLTYIYYTAGRSRICVSRIRLYTLTVLHTNVVALAICAVTVNAMSTALDRRVIEGAILSSAARPCAWLPISFLSCNTIPSLAAVNYAMSILVSPLAYFLLCGRIPIPPIDGVIFTTLTTLAPFAIGHLSKPGTETCFSKLSALLVLYTECCALLREAEGSLYVTDVVATLFLAVCWVLAVAMSGVLYARGGLLSSTEARCLLAVATPKATNIGSVSSLCIPPGLARLPAVFIAPAQALLLAAIITDEEHKIEDYLPR